MLRRWTAALVIASAVTGAPLEAVCASAQAAESFELLPRSAGPERSHRLAWTCAIAGVAMVAGSFPISDLADRRYDDYLAETNPAAIEDRFQAARRADHLSSAALVTGEALLVTAVWLRFVHRPRHAGPARAALALAPGRCAIHVRF